MGKRLTSRPAGPAFVDVDLDGAGRQLGHISIPHSPDDDAWGTVRVPIAIIGNGEGPTVVVEGGNHGDEYEGQIVVAELIRDQDPAAVNGRLILLPAVNAPAAAAGRRTSPVDGLNYNRVFPGDPLGTMTQQIAAFVTDEIFPRADAFVSLHSGGSSLLILPSAAIEPCEDRDLYKRNVAAALAFGAPKTVVIANLGDQRTATATACRAGLTTVATELGGGGGVIPEALSIAQRGTRNVLHHLGVIECAPDTPAAISPDLLELPGVAAYVFADDDGVFEPFHTLGAEVRAGEPAGRLHFLLTPERPPMTLHYGADGLLYGLRRSGAVRPGACCAVVAAPFTGDLP